MSPTFSSRGVLRACALLCGAALAASSAVAQTWDYKAYIKDPRNGQYDATRFRTTTISIEEKNGQWSFQMTNPGKGDPCISRGALPAEVQKTEQTTTITVTPLLADCEPFRYVIQNDGSGGVKLYKRGDNWVADKFDHGLTPTK
ncbi:MAG TPA: hypothetical protein PKC97_18475 [Burkholderiaceae bacterium]|nr:hypothetical protein [Burkholderiaceae bacterium]